jgi:hypothetical protein
MTGKLTQAEAAELRYRDPFIGARYLYMPQESISDLWPRGLFPLPIVTVLAVKTVFLGGRTAITTPFMSSHVEQGFGRIPLNVLYGPSWRAVDNVIALAPPSSAGWRN